MQLTDARLLPLLSSKDRAVRKASFIPTLANGYNKLGNTIAATQTPVRSRPISSTAARITFLTAAVVAAMFPDEIDEKGVRQPDRRRCTAASGR